MDNLDKSKGSSVSEQTAKKNSDRERERPPWRARDERYYGETAASRSSALEKRRIRRKEKKANKKFAKLNAQYNTPKPRNFHHQGYLPPPPERFERNQFSIQFNNRQNTTRYDYDARTTNGGYTTRRQKGQNYTQSSRSNSRNRYHFRSRKYDKRQSQSPQRHYNRSSNRIRDSSRQYNDSTPSFRHRTLSQSPKPTSSTEEQIKYQVNTQFASSSYLDKANVNSLYLKFPQPKLLVLDLNGTLVYRDNAKRDIILRPYMENFMNYIFGSDSFFVMVWSSAQPKNVDRMVRAAFGPYEKKLVAKWTRKHLNLSDHDYHQKVETIKDLEKVWRELNSSNYSSTLPRWDQTNTILIDDSCVKAKLQPYNAIHLPDFDGERCRNMNDRELYSVIEYLGKLHKQSNVSAYIKKYPYISRN